MAVAVVYNDGYNATRQHYCRCLNADAASMYTPPASAAVNPTATQWQLHPTSCQLPPLVQGPGTFLHHNYLQRWLQQLLRCYTRHMTSCWLFVMQQCSMLTKTHVSPTHKTPKPHTCTTAAHIKSPCKSPASITAERQDRTPGGAYCDADTPNPVQFVCDAAPHPPHIKQRCCVQHTTCHGRRTCKCFS